MRTAVVIPYGAGRLDNLHAVMDSLEAQESDMPEVVVVVADGPEATAELDSRRRECKFPQLRVDVTNKHVPGHLHPRNIGVRAVRDRHPEIDHVWFLDSDVIVEPDCYKQYLAARGRADLDRVLMGPYEWLPPGQREALSDLHNDPRWPSFRQHGSEEVIREDLSAGLACFSGNIIWPIAEFVRIGGFWDELHHGRCEDGEIGLRAVAMGVPLSFVATARGYHLDHPRNVQWILAANTRDVPMLNERHPWVQGQGLFVVERDGKRFEVKCPRCQAEVNTGEWWAHAEDCGATL